MSVEHSGEEWRRAGRRSRKSGRSDSGHGSEGGPGRAGPPSQNLDRLPPHSLEAEQGVIGCCLLDPKEALGLAMEAFGAREVFYDERLQFMFSTLSTMVNEGMFIDPVTFGQRLKDLGRLEACGGIAMVASLMNATPSAASVEHYVAIVQGKYRRRRMLAVLAECQGRIWDREEEEVTGLLNGIETAVLEAGDDGATSSGLRSAKEVMYRTVDLVENCFRRGRGVIDGVATGFSYLDKMLGGLHNGEFGVLAARPSAGKTAMMMAFAKHVALTAKKKVGVFSVEMQDTALMMRLWCDVASVNMQQLRTGFASESDMKRLTTHAAKLANMQMWFDDTASLPVQVYRARARRMKRLGVELILVDYVQLMSNPDLEGRERHLEVASISKALKASCKELNIPVIALAQLNRETEKNPNRKPCLADLRESGQIEQDADWVGLLYKPKTKRSKDEVVQGDFDEDGNDKGNPIIPVNLLIAKQRNGPTGDCQFLFNREFMRFVDRFDGTGAEEGESAARERVRAIDEAKEDKGGKQKMPLGVGVSSKGVAMPTDEEMGLLREMTND